jgi:SAM-dependent methyltransferase
MLAPRQRRSGTGKSMGTILNPYDELPYDCRAIPATAPEQLVICSRLFGGPTPPWQKTRVLELGCGDGANLIRLAFYDRDSEYVGVDGSEVHIRRAKEASHLFGFNNLNFAHKDLRLFAQEQGEPFDFIIVHGLYSWVPEDVRSSIRTILQSRLSANGLAYVSYNTFPGWKVRGVVRETLQRHTEQLSNLHEKAQKARAMARFFAAKVKTGTHPYQPLLTWEYELAGNSSDSTLIHDYLADVNDAFWFRDFMAGIQQVGLAYVADAWYQQPGGLVTSRQHEELAELKLERLLLEESVDMLTYRQLRASLLCHQGQEQATPDPNALLDEVFLACSLTNSSDPFRLERGVPEVFRDARGTETKLESPLAKVVFWLLANLWPGGGTLSSLVEQANQLLAAQSLAQGTPDEVVELKKTIYDHVLSGHVVQRYQEPASRVPLGPHPKATRLARWEAERHEHLSTPMHLVIPVDYFHRQVVRRLDGTKSEEQLVRDFMREVLEHGHQLHLPDLPTDDPGRLEESLDQWVRKAVGAINAWGFFEGTSAT